MHRIAHTIREAGEQLGGYFATTKDADAFEAELALPAGPPERRLQLAGLVQLRPLCTSTASTGSGGNCGLESARPTRIVTRPPNAYERPQCSACFIQSVDDDLMSIYELVKNEARLFKYGSGTGTQLLRAARPAGEALGRRHVLAAS